MNKDERIKILLAEDDDDLREIVSTHLTETFACEIELVKNGAEAIDRLMTNNSYDLIISDFLMPVLNGRNVFEYNIRGKNLPFIMMTASDVKEDQVLSQIESFHPLNKLFLKPFLIDEFCQHIRHIITHIGKV